MKENTTNGKGLLWLKLCKEVGAKRWDCDVIQFTDSDFFHKFLIIVYVLIY